MSQSIMDNRSGVYLASVAHPSNVLNDPIISLDKPPGYMKNNPDCPCGWKMKRIYATVQVRSSGTRRTKSRHRPIGWCCLDKCGYLDLDSEVQNPIHHSLIEDLLKLRELNK